jgi:hypothetical protein
MTCFSSVELQIMVPLTIDAEWSMYALDMHRKVLNVLDPVYTDEDEDSYEAKHGDRARQVLEGIAAVGAALEDGWDTDLDEWEISYNVEMHVPCLG